MAPQHDHRWQCGVWENDAREFVVIEVSPGSFGPLIIQLWEFSRIDERESFQQLQIAGAAAGACYRKPAFRWRRIAEARRLQRICAARGFGQ
jgi:hypothetical protein